MPLKKLEWLEKSERLWGAARPAKKIAVLGLTFKPETDDMRDAPALMILPALKEKGAEIVATDPHGMEEAKKYLPELNYVDDPYVAIKDADAVVLMTEWNEYRSLDLEKSKN